MIRSFRHLGLRRFYEKDQARGVPPVWRARVAALLARLDAAVTPSDMDLPGLRLHRLRGDLAGFWAVNVSGNWRMIFRFEDDGVWDVDLIDYH